MRRLPTRYSGRRAPEVRREVRLVLTSRLALASGVSAGMIVGVIGGAATLDPPRGLVLRAFAEAGLAAGVAAAVIVAAIVGITTWRGNPERLALLVAAGCTVGGPFAVLGFSLLVQPADALLRWLDPLDASARVDWDGLAPVALLVAPAIGLGFGVPLGGLVSALAIDLASPRAVSALRARALGVTAVFASAALVEAFALLYHLPSEVLTVPRVLAWSALTVDTLALAVSELRARHFLRRVSSGDEPAYRLVPRMEATVADDLLDDTHAPCPLALVKYEPATAYRDRPFAIALLRA